MTAAAAASLRDSLMWAKARSRVPNTDTLVPRGCVRCVQERKEDGMWS